MVGVFTEQYSNSGWSKDTTAGRRRKALRLYWAYRLDLQSVRAKSDSYRTRNNNLPVRICNPVFYHACINLPMVGVFTDQYINNGWSKNTTAGKGDNRSLSLSKRTTIRSLKPSLCRGTSDFVRE